jgi:cytochrome c
MKSTALCFGLAIVALVGWGLRAGTVQAAGQNEAAKPEFYTTKVQPILQANCYRCHGGMNHRGGLSIQTRAGMLKGGHEGPVLVPGDPAKSLLVRLIRHEGPASDPMPMPPKLPKLSDADIATVEQWVRAGAIMPEDVVKP